MSERLWHLLSGKLDEIAAFSARTPAPCPSCDVLSRQYGLVIEQNAALAARNRALEGAIADLVVSGRQVRAGLADLQKAAGA